MRSIVSRMPSGSRIAMHIEDRRVGARVIYAHHSDDQGQEYRLADTFGTRSRHFVHSMLNSLGPSPAMRSFFSGRRREEIDLTKVRSTQANSGLIVCRISATSPTDRGLVDPVSCRLDA